MARCKTLKEGSSPERAWRSRAVRRATRSRPRATRRGASAKLGVHYQSSWKGQSNFAYFNGAIDFIDDANNPFDTGFGYANAATGVFTRYRQASKYAYPEWVYENLEWYAQDNWRATARLTLDYGVRFYYLTPQWDQTLEASSFLPDRFDSQNAARLYTPVCIGASPCSGDARRGMDPALVGTVPPTMDNTVDGRFIGRLTPDSERFNGASSHRRRSTPGTSACRTTSGMP